MNSLTLRKATPNDSEFAYLTKRAAFRQYVEKVWGWNEEEQQLLHATRFDAQEFRVVNFLGKDVGIIATVSTPDCLKVNQLFLWPEHQGKHIGRECMALIMNEARHMGLPVRLQVMKVNPRARAFYDRLGFSVTDATDTHYLMEWIPPGASVPSGA
jgi:ribosomal protein S18 acetylase RimI-like enzyme